MICKRSEPLYHIESRPTSCAGTSEIPTYVLDFPEKGGVALKKTGTKPIYEIIQANKVNCDLQNVIESCVHSNQYAVCTHDNLNTMISDFTGLTNLGDIYSASKRMENTWKELPLEVRESFDSDIKKFIRGFGTDEFHSKVNDGFNKFYGSIKKNTISEVVPPIGSTDITTDVTIEVPNKEVVE